MVTTLRFFGRDMRYGHRAYAALVVTQTVGGDNELVLDARLAGVGAGAIAIVARAPLPAVVVVAAVATALTRLVT